MTSEHDNYSCPGCDRVLNVSELADWLCESVHTLYKWPAIGYPSFPRRLKLRNARVAVSCRSMKQWLAEATS